jgi:hypothetical protein
MEAKHKPGKIKQTLEHHYKKDNDLNPLFWLIYDNYFIIATRK